LRPSTTLCGQGAKEFQTQFFAGVLQLQVVNEQRSKSEIAIRARDGSIRMHDLSVGALSRRRIVIESGTDDRS
jgi:hypothetical protein